MTETNRKWQIAKVILIILVIVISAASLMGGFKLLKKGLAEREEETAVEETSVEETSVTDSDVNDVVTGGLENHGANTEDWWGVVYPPSHSGSSDTDTVAPDTEPPETEAPETEPPETEPTTPTAYLSHTPDGTSEGLYMCSVDNTVEYNLGFYTSVLKPNTLYEVHFSIDLLKLDSPFRFIYDDGGYYIRYHENYVNGSITPFHKAYFIIERVVNGMFQFTSDSQEGVNAVFFFVEFDYFPSDQDSDGDGIDDIDELADSLKSALSFTITEIA